MLVDDTLREGLQAPGMSYTIEERMKLASMLTEAGIRQALVAYPSAHSSEAEVTSSIVRKGLMGEVFGLGRTVESDIDRIYETGANISMHLPFSFDDTAQFLEAIRYASTKDRKVEVAVVDVMKYDPDTLMNLAEKVISAGADIIQLPDTTGRATPHKFGSIISEARKRFPDVEIEVHCHNDAGLSVANVIAGIEAGADRVDTTVYGLGERNGISDQLTVAEYLRDYTGREHVDRGKLLKVYEYVLQLVQEKMGLEFFQHNYPNTGKNVKTHTAGTHAAFSNVFEGSDFSVNVYAGRSMVRKILSASNLDVSDEELKLIVMRIKDEAVESGKALKVDDIMRIGGEVYGKSN